MQKRMAVKILSMKTVKTQNLELIDWTGVEGFTDAAARMMNSSLSEPIFRVVIPIYDFAVFDRGVKSI